jgi:hypothetical protein
VVALGQSGIEVPALSLNSNLAALKATQSLDAVGTELSSLFERLSSGKRINRASDDPAGLAEASVLRMTGRVYTRARQNVNDSISFFNVADAATSELKNILDRLSELATQASNGVMTDVQRQALSGASGMSPDTRDGRDPRPTSRSVATPPAPHEWVSVPVCLASIIFPGRVASSKNVTQGSVSIDESAGLVPTRDRSASSPSLFRTDGDRLLASPVPALAGMNKRPDHHMTPLPYAALQGPQLPLQEPTGVIPVQPFHQGLGRRIGILLEPQKDLRPDLLERILPGSPSAR